MSSTKKTKTPLDSVWILQGKTHHEAHVLSSQPTRLWIKWVVSGKKEWISRDTPLVDQEPIGRRTNKRNLEKTNSNKKKKPRHNEDDEDLLFLPVAKCFGEVLYRGTITGTKENETGSNTYWRVEYEDGDTEDMDREEVEQAMALYEEEQAILWKPKPSPSYVLCEDDEGEEAKPKPAAKVVTPDHNHKKKRNREGRPEPVPLVKASSEMVDDVLGTATPKVFRKPYQFPYRDARVAKLFDGTLYYGRVTSCSLEEEKSFIVVRHSQSKKDQEFMPMWVWRVRYTDGDEEDLDLTELHEALELYRSRRGLPAAANRDTSSGSEAGDNSNNETTEGAPLETPQGKYYEVEEVLERKYQKMGGGAEIAKYLIKWKGYEETSWVAAEQLDANSLAEAWKKFPPPTAEEAQAEAEKEKEKLKNADGSNKNDSNHGDAAEAGEEAEKQNNNADPKKNISNDGEVDVDRTKDATSEDNSANENKSNDLHDKAEMQDSAPDEKAGSTTACSLDADMEAAERVDDETKGTTETKEGATAAVSDDGNGTKDTGSESITASSSDQPTAIGKLGNAAPENDVALAENTNENGERHVTADELASSNYDKTGTAEVRIKWKTYRIGHFYWTDDQCIAKITKLIPKKELAECERFIPSERSFLEGSHPQMPKESYVRVGQRMELPLSRLRRLCNYNKHHPKSDWIYDYNPNSTRPSFCYYKEGGKIPPANPGKSKPTVLELYAGAGGMCLGFRNAGMETRWIVEMNEYAAATIRANFKGIHPPQIYTEAVGDFVEQVQKGNPAYPAKDEIEHIHGSPPCQGFSRANRGGGTNDEDNNDQTNVFINTIGTIRPATVSYENVEGILMEKNRHYLQNVVSQLLGMDYQVRVEVLKASDYGDPQNRKRVILWAAKAGMILPSTPPATHGENLLPKRTVRDAIGALEKYPVFADKKGSLQYPNGTIDHNFRTTNNLTDPDLHVLRADEPSRTVTSCPAMHYRGDRFLTVRESACLQSFPWDYQFFGDSVLHQYKQVGNAVPVMMATQVARSVAKVHGMP